MGRERNCLIHYIPTLFFPSTIRGGSEEETEIFSGSSLAHARTSTEQNERESENRQRGENLIYSLHDARWFKSLRLFLFSLFQMIHDVNANALLYRALDRFFSTVQPVYVSLLSFSRSRIRRKWPSLPVPSLTPPRGWRSSSCSSREAFLTIVQEEN